MTQGYFDFSRNLHQKSPESRAVLVHRYGEADIEEKEARWLESSSSSIWLFPDYRAKMNEVISAYIAGNFYCAITGACCLVERALNVLVIQLRSFYSVPAKWTKAVSRDKHIQNWEACWSCLHDWKELSHEQVSLCKKIHRIRNDVCHYNPSFDYSVQAKMVLDLVNHLFDSLFSVFHRKDVFRIFEIPGEIWVKESVAKSPFVRQFVSPLCSLMSACSSFEGAEYVEYDEGCDDLSEPEFIDRRTAFGKSKAERIRKDVYVKQENAGKKWTIRIL